MKFATLLALRKRAAGGEYTPKPGAKIARDAFLYMEGSSEDFAQCASCFNFVKAEKLCSNFGREYAVNAGDTCGLYVPGKYDGHQIAERVKPQDADYAKATEVRCENCKFGGVECDLYVELNKELPDLFDLDTMIKPQACCNAWTKPSFKDKLDKSYNPDQPREPAGSPEGGQWSGGGGGSSSGGSNSGGGASKPAEQEDDYARPRIVSSAAEQEAALRESWNSAGPDKDYEDVWNAKGGEDLWQKEVSAWNEANGTSMDPDRMDMGLTGPNGAFLTSFESKYLAGQIRDFPGVKQANEWFADNGYTRFTTFTSKEQAGRFYNDYDYTLTFKRALSFDDALRKYSEDQPRVPAGSPDGGQWAGGGGEGGGGAGSGGGSSESGSPIAAKWASESDRLGLTSTFDPSSHGDPIVYNGIKEGYQRTGYLFVTQDQEGAAFHGTVAAFRIKPGAKLYADLEDGRNRTGAQTLLEAKASSSSGIVRSSDLIPVSIGKRQLVDHGAPIAPVTGVTNGHVCGSRVECALTGDPVIDAVLTAPTTSRNINSPIVDRSYDVPYGAGGSDPLEDPTTYIDRHVPKTMTVGGVTFDPAEPYVIHENVEQSVMEKLIAGGMDDVTAYKTAHFGWAEVAEGAWYDAHGIDRDEAERQERVWLEKIQHDNPEHPPPNLYVKPYPLHYVQLAQGEQYEEPPPTDAEMAEARRIIAAAYEVPLGKGYNPDQPREPAGSPEGGQWAGGGGSGSAAWDKGMHGTRAGMWDSNRTDPVYLTNDKSQASAYARGVHLGGEGNGEPHIKSFAMANQNKIYNIDNHIARAMDEEGDAEAGVASGIAAAKAAGAHYAQFYHPNAGSEGEHEVRISLYPSQDLEHIGTTWRLAKSALSFDEILGKHLRGGLDKAFNPDQPREPAGSPEGGRWTGGDTGGFPKAGSKVAGLEVLSDVPNLSSIGSSLDDYTVLSGVREVPFSAFEGAGSPSDTSRTQELAAGIKESGAIKPLIVVVEEHNQSAGPYILEGSHRFDALQIAGYKSFPAVVVVDHAAMEKRLSFYEALGKHSRGGREMLKDSELSAIMDRMRKLQPGAGDVHQTSAGAGKRKKDFKSTLADIRTGKQPKPKVVESESNDGDALDKVWASNDDLPDGVKNSLPAEAQSVWRKVANDRIKAGQDDKSAIKQAWSAVKNGWEKKGDSWVKKAEEVDWAVDAVVIKTETKGDKQLVFGFASMSEIDGKLVVDKQDDIIMPEDLEDAAYDYVKYCRSHGDMHERMDTGVMVESMVFTKEKQEKLGIDLGCVGWWVGFKIDCPETWASIKSGALSEFSIGGRAVRVPTDE